MLLLILVLTLDSPRAPNTGVAPLAKSTEGTEPRPQSSPLHQLTSLQQAALSLVATTLSLATIFQRVPSLPRAPGGRAVVQNTTAPPPKLVTQLITVQFRVLRHSMLLLSLLPGVCVLLSIVYCLMGGGHPHTRLLALPGEMVDLTPEHDSVFLWLWQSVQRLPCDVEGRP